MCGESKHDGERVCHEMFHDGIADCSVHMLVNGFGGEEIIGML